ncbi:hypothetical protein FPV67DRAFT_223255 [Lyophyllum atratum]|nr:hypothetical protein FPV67DRAFT_223255 [Lyophyllum atratum]
MTHITSLFSIISDSLDCTSLSFCYPCHGLLMPRTTSQDSHHRLPPASGMGGSFCDPTATDRISGRASSPRPSSLTTISSLSFSLEPVIQLFSYHHLHTIASNIPAPASPSFCYPCYRLLMPQPLLAILINTSRLPRAPAALPVTPLRILRGSFLDTSRCRSLPRQSSLTTITLLPFFDEPIIHLFCYHHHHCILSLHYSHIAILIPYNVYHITLSFCPH